MGAIVPPGPQPLVWVPRSQPLPLQPLELASGAREMPASCGQGLLDTPDKPLPLSEPELPHLSNRSDR